MTVTRAVTPWWFWLAAGLAVLWNAGGAFDYVLSQIGSAWYLANFDEEVLAWLAEMPAWRTALWAFAVWSAVAASLLLVLRRGLALTAYGFSLAFILIGIALDVLALGMGGLYAGAHAVGMALVTLLTVAQFWFAKASRRRGILR